MDVSVIIPARNEEYLAKTVEDVLKNSRAETEVIAVCNGYWPDPRVPDDPRVVLVHTTDPIGQRQAVNLGAKLSRAKYILKCDAHTAFDEGFDVKLMEDCEYDWTVIPRMYNLNIETWEPKKKKVTDYMWIRSIDAPDKPFRHCYWDAKAHKECPEERTKHKEWAKKQGDISDVMTGQGACFFMHRQRFWDLEGMDEKHGHWGQMGVEIACKAWLSGGRQVVNKKTWFAHWFRGGVVHKDGSKGFPWPASGRKQQKAREYSQDLWLNNKWHLQKRPLSWLVKKFMPLPDWDRYLETHNGEFMAKPRKMSEGETPQYTQEYCKRQLTEEEQNVKYEPAYLKTARKNDSRYFMQGRELSVTDMYENRIRYCRPEKHYGIMWQQKIIPPFLERVLKGEQFTDEQLKEFEYYTYLVSRLNPQNNIDGVPDDKGVKHCIGKMRDYINLANDIKENGLKAPIDLFCYDKPFRKEGKWWDKVIIVRGSRRIAILYHLGVKKVPARIWRDEWLAKRFIPDSHWPVNDNSIHAHAVRQFVKMGARSTDKYWRHNYTPWYDNHIGKFQRGFHTKYILELGVKTGVSLLLWHDAFRAAEVYGLDRRPDLCLPEIRKKKRIHLIEGDQTDTELLHKIGKETKFHVIIDDCSHRPRHQRISFDVLWNYLEPGGVYVLEDMQSNYRSKYRKDSIVPHVASMIEDIYESHKVREIQFYPNIIFITKA